MLLHGDLHQDNILLSNNNKWIAIDHKEVIGEPAYEIGAFTRNPIPQLLEQPNIQAIITKRLNIFSKMLNIDRQQLKE